MCCEPHDGAHPSLINSAACALSRTTERAISLGVAALWHGLDGSGTGAAQRGGC